MLVPRVSQILPEAKLVISGHSPHTSRPGMGTAGGEARGQPTNSLYFRNHPGPLLPPFQPQTRQTRAPWLRHSCPLLSSCGSTPLQRLPPTPPPPRPEFHQNPSTPTGSAYGPIIPSSEPSCCCRCDAESSKGTCFLVPGLFLALGPGSHGLAWLGHWTPDRELAGRKCLC